MKKPLFIFLISLFSVSVFSIGAMAVECGSTLTEGCSFSSSVTLDGGTYVFNNRLNADTENIIINGNNSIIYFSTDGVAERYGLYISKNNVTISNLVFINGNQTSLEVKRYAINIGISGGTNYTRLNNISIYNTTSYGIYTTSTYHSVYDNIKIYGGDISGGITIRNSDNITLSNSYLISPNKVNIYCENSNNINYNLNFVNSTFNESFILGGCSNNEIYNNSIYGFNDFSIYVSSTSLNNRLINNFINNRNSSAIRILANNTFVYNNWINMSNSSGYGILVYNQANSTNIINNTCYSEEANCITASNSNFNYISNNSVYVDLDNSTYFHDINGNRRGISLTDNADYNLVEYNKVISNSGHAIESNNKADNNIIRYNNISSSDSVCIYIADSINVSVYSNTGYGDNYFTLRADNSTYSNIYNNSFYSVTGSALYLSSISLNNTIFNNYIKSNNKCIGGLAGFSVNNSFINNNIDGSYEYGLCILSSNYNNVGNNNKLVYLYNSTSYIYNLSSPSYLNGTLSSGTRITSTEANITLKPNAEVYIYNS